VIFTNTDACIRLNEIPNSFMIFYGILITFIDRKAFLLFFL